MDVIVPTLGEATEGVVTRWHRKIGETVKADDPLLDMETDKVSTEVTAPCAGVLSAILAEEGVTVKIGERVAVISD